VPSEKEAVDSNSAAVRTRDHVLLM